LNDLGNHLNNCIFDSTRIPDNVKNYFNNIEKKDSTTNINLYEDDDTHNYLGFNKNSSLKARLFNKNSKLILSSLNNDSKSKLNDNFNSILGYNDEDLLKEILNNIENKDLEKNNKVFENKFYLSSNAINENKKNDFSILNHLEKDSTISNYSNKSYFKENNKINNKDEKLIDNTNLFNLSKLIYQ